MTVLALVHDGDDDWCPIAIVHTGCCCMHGKAQHAASTSIGARRLDCRTTQEACIVQTVHEQADAKMSTSFLSAAVTRIVCVAVLLARVHCATAGGLGGPGTVPRTVPGVDALPPTGAGAVGVHAACATLNGTWRAAEFDASTYLFTESTWPAFPAFGVHCITSTPQKGPVRFCIGSVTALLRVAARLVCVRLARCSVRHSTSSTLVDRTSMYTNTSCQRQNRCRWSAGGAGPARGA